MYIYIYIYIYIYVYMGSNYVILGVVKRNPLFFHSISCKNNGFLFTTPNIWKFIDRRKNMIKLYMEVCSKKKI